jgi:hypothetical protein
MALSITITDAGRAALINAQNTGSAAMVINRIGVSASHATGNLKALTALPNERKKLATFAGEVVADDKIHVTVRDETNDAYDLRAFGIYFANGVLFAVCTQAEPIMQKAAAAMLLQSVDIALVTLDTANIEFGGAGFSNPPATTERLGVVELATVEETAALEDATRAVTPFGLGRILLAWAQNFASRLHSHDIGDVDELGLVLAGKAAKDHKHDAADTTSGTFEVARIPKLAIAWVNGLADTLATLALKDHKHDAADITSGVLSVGRIPALAMEKITGLANALAAKADLAGAIFSGPLGVARRGGNAILSIDGDAGRVRQLIWQTEGLARWILQADETTESGANAGSDLVLMNRSDTGAYVSTALRVKRETGEFQFGRRPSWAGYTPWDSNNLNPDSFAAAAHTHEGLLVRQTYAPGTDLNTLTSSGIIGVHANPAANLNFPVIATGALEVFASAATRVYQRYTTSSTTAPDIYERTLSGATWSPWRKVVMDDLASTYAARGLIEMATDAEAIAAVDQERAINPYILKRRVDARAASSAETIAGTLADKFITPAALWSFAKSIGSSGYQQIPGTNLIIQWGVRAASVPEGPVDTFLPVAFGGGCLFASATPRNASGVVTMDFYMQVMGRWQDRISWYANRANGSAGNMSGFEWMAIGLATGNPDPAYYTGGGGGGGGELYPEL